MAYRRQKKRNKAKNRDPKASRRVKLHFPRNRTRSPYYNLKGQFCHLVKSDSDPRLGIPTSAQRYTSEFSSGVTATTLRTLEDVERSSRTRRLSSQTIASRSTGLPGAALALDEDSRGVQRYGLTDVSRGSRRAVGHHMSDRNRLVARPLAYIDRRERPISYSARTPRSCKGEPALRFQTPAPHHRTRPIYLSASPASAPL